MKKIKFLSIITALAMVLSFCPISVFAVSGDGSEENPYLAATEAELRSAVEEAGNGMTYIKLTDDITLTESIFLNSNCDIDLNRRTIYTSDNNSISDIRIYNTTNVRIHDGFLVSEGENAYLCIVTSQCEDFYMENVEAVTDDFWTISLIMTSGEMKNCRIESRAGTPLKLSAELYTPNDKTVYDFTAVNCDLYGKNSDDAYFVRNQEAKQTSYESYPRAYYNFTLNGQVICDGSDFEEFIYAKSASVVGGYSDAWNADKYNTQITYTVAPSYTVTIPEYVTLGQTAAVSAENVVLEKGKQVEVALAGTSGENNAFTLQSEEGATLEYSVEKNGSAVYAGNTVLTVNPETEQSGSINLAFTAPGNTQFAGEYSGTVTFTVAVKEVSGE